MGKYRLIGTGFDRVFRNNLNTNFDDIDTDIKSQKQRVDDLITGTPQPSEVVDARGGMPVLRDRLDATDAQLAETSEGLSQYKTKFKEFRNTDGAVNQLIKNALSYIGKPDFVYGNYHTLFNDDASLQNGKYEIDCSSFVHACLSGITYENSKYFNGKNYPNNSGITLNPDYQSDYHGRFLANDLAQYAFEMGWTYPGYVADIVPGDILFFASQAEDPNYWEGIGHVSIVTRANQRNERSITVIDADRNRTPVVQEVTYTLAQLDALKLKYVGRFPLQDSTFEPRAINYDANKTIVQSSYKIGDINTTKDLKENQMYTLFIETSFPDDTRYPIIHMSAEKSIYSFGSPLSKRPDNRYKVNFFIPEGTLATLDSSYKRKLEIYLSGSSPYPTATTTLLALYEGYVSEFPGFVEDIPQEGTFTPTLYGETTAGVNTYSTQLGRYTRVGDRIFFEVSVTLTEKDSAMAGNVLIGGLPLPLRSLSGLRAVCELYHSFVSSDSNRPTTQALIFPTENYIRLRKVGATTAYNDISLDSSQINNNTVINISGSYLV
jgi:cell wall-associated NlpC family hydrolase